MNKKSGFSKARTKITKNTSEKKRTKNGQYKKWKRKLRERGKRERCAL